MAAAAEGLLLAREHGGVGVLTGGRLSVDRRLRVRQVRPTGACTPTTSTSAPGRVRPRRTRSSARYVAGGPAGHRRRDLRRGGAGHHRAADRPGAGGGIRRPVPAAAQGVAAARAPRSSRSPRCRPVVWSRWAARWCRRRPAPRRSPSAGCLTPALEFRDWPTSFSATVLSCWSGSGRPRCPVCCRRPRRWWTAAVPGSPGCPVGPVTVARWTPVRSAACCRAPGRSTDDHEPCRRRADLGRDAAAPPGPQHRPDPVRRRRRTTARAADRRRVAGGPAGSGAGAIGHPQRRLRGQPRAAPHGDHRTRRRGLPGRRGRREGRRVPQLGGPPRHLRCDRDRQERARRRPGARHPRGRDGRRSLHADPGGRHGRAEPARPVRPATGRSCRRCPAR